MKHFLATTLLVALCGLTWGDESGFGFDRPGKEKATSTRKAPDPKMDQLLRPHVFAQYNKFATLTEAGEGLYQAYYRLPANVYVPDFEGNLLGIQEWLEEEGVEFGVGSSVSLEENLRILDVVQTMEQLTRLELFLARFGGRFSTRVHMQVFELPLLDGWDLIEEVRTLEDHCEAGNLARNRGAKVVESFSAFLDLGKRAKLQRPREREFGEDKSNADQESPPVSASFEFETHYIERFDELLVNFAYRRAAGEFDEREVVTEVRIPNRGGMIVSSWRSGDRLQFLYLSGEVTETDAVERVRKVLKK